MEEEEKLQEPQAQEYKELRPANIYDVAANETWLEDMARKGYRLIRMTNWSGVFVKDEPKPSRYRMQPLSRKEQQPEEAQVEAYRELGWEYAGTITGCFHVWRCDAPAAPELDTDPVVQGMGYGYLKRKTLRESVIAILLLMLLAAAALLAFAAETPVLTTVEDFVPGEWTCRILSGVLITVLIICQMKSMVTLLRSLNAGVPLRRPRPYRLQKWLARGLVFFWFGWFVLSILGSGHGITGGSLDGGWDAGDSHHVPKAGVVYVDLVDLEGAEETDFWGCYTKVQELCPRMYETSQLSLEPGDGVTRQVLASAETTYYRMLTKGLARKLAEEMTRMRPASMGVSYHDTLEPVETQAELDGFWWSQKEMGTQHALALLDRQVLLVEYEGETDLRTAGEYFYNLLDEAA